jgi:AbrB family looped-hinge helix DNA binding protein
MYYMTMDVGNVTNKGQVTIPKHLRKKYKIDDKVLFVDTGDGVLVRQVPKLSELKGILKGSMDPDSINQQEKRLEATRQERLMAVIEQAKNKREKRPADWQRK